MITMCGTCGRTFEASKCGEEHGSGQCPSCQCDLAGVGHDEPPYQSDLRALLERAQMATRSAPRASESCVEVPPSVREAICHAEAPIFSEQLRARIEARRPRLRLAAFPVIALALVGVILRAGQRLDEPGAARLVPPASPLTTQTPSGIDAVVPSPEQPIAVAAEPTARDPIARPVPPGPPARSVLAPPRPLPTAARPHATASPTSAPTAERDPPSLMQAITNAVRSGATPTDRR